MFAVGPLHANGKVQTHSKDIEYLRDLFRNEEVREAVIHNPEYMAEDIPPGFDWRDSTLVHSEFKQKESAGVGKNAWITSLSSVRRGPFFP